MEMVNQVYEFCLDLKAIFYYTFDCLIASLMRDSTDNEELDKLSWFLVHFSASMMIALITKKLLTHDS